MKTRELLQDRESAVYRLAAKMSKLPSYQNGLRANYSGQSPQEAALDQANKYADHGEKMHNSQKRWWGIVHTDNGNIMIWTNNSSEVNIVLKDKSVVYHDEVEGNAWWLARYKLPTTSFFFGTRNEVINKILQKGKAKTKKLPPVNMVF